MLGNHDLSYLDSNYRCSGFSESKLWAIKGTDVDLTKLQHYCWVGDWLCTHAGLSKDFMNLYNPKNLPIGGFLDDINRDRLYNCSPYRGDRDSHSGILWCDYNEFVDIPNTKQIFGHTVGNVRKTENHICLDTNLHHIAIFQDNKMEVKEIQDDYS